MDADQPKKQSFREAAQAYDRTSKLFRELMRYKDEIASLRQKGASFHTIRELLQNDNLKVSWKTVSRFCRKMFGAEKRRKKLGVPTQPTISTKSDPPGENGNDGLFASMQDQRNKSPGPWVPRKRGPRIADSKNL